MTGKVTDKLLAGYRPFNSVEEVLAIIPELGLF